MKRLEAKFEEFCRTNGISPKISYEMPVGYEDANGTYDVTLNTLFLNQAILQTLPEYERLFYLFHELRHALQYLRPEKFDLQIQRSRFYVILYNGQCYKLAENAWKDCTLQGSEDFFTRAYLSLPYELDANAFAFETVKTICGENIELRDLYAMWLPKEPMQYAQIEKIFDQIDIAVL